MAVQRSASALVAVLSLTAGLIGLTQARLVGQKVVPDNALIEPAAHHPVADFASDLERVLLGRGAVHRQAAAPAPGPASSPAASPAGSPAGPLPPDDFMQVCLNTTKAIVIEAEGKPPQVSTKLSLICSALAYPPDVQVCGEYKKSLMGHLHQFDIAWNLDKMDYDLFCYGMYKIVQSLENVE